MGSTAGAIQFGRTREWNEYARCPKNTTPPMQKKYNSSGLSGRHLQKIAIDQRAPTKKTGFSNAASTKENSQKNLKVGCQVEASAALSATWRRVIQTCSEFQMITGSAQSARTS